MEYASGLIKLKPETENKVEEWKRKISSKLDEAATTLQDEDVQIESWFKIDIEGSKYLLWYLSAKSIEHVLKFQ